MSATFVALDVETANDDRASICAIGLVSFTDGDVTAAHYILVNPEDYFNDFNVSIHGITEEEVAGAPTFPAIAGELADLLSGRIVVAHSSFDQRVIARAHAKYNLTPFPCRWLDSEVVARLAWPDQFPLPRCSLVSVAEWLGIEFQHHHAGSDARVAGEIVVRAVKDTGRSVEQWLTRPRQSSASQGLRREGNPEGPRYGEWICITGTPTMGKAALADLADAAGCKVRKTMNNDITILVICPQDPRRLAGKEKSDKQLYAEKRRAKGHQLRDMTEQEFLVYIGEELDTPLLGGG